MNAGKMIHQVAVHRIQRAITEGKQGGVQVTIAASLLCLIELMGTNRVRVRQAGSLERSGYLMTWMDGGPELKAGDLVTYSGRQFVLSDVEWDNIGGYSTGHLKARV